MINFKNIKNNVIYIKLFLIFIYYTNRCYYKRFRMLMMLVSDSCKRLCFALILYDNISCYIVSNVRNFKFNDKNLNNKMLYFLLGKNMSFSCYAIRRLQEIGRMYVGYVCRTSCKSLQSCFFLFR